MKGTKVRIEGTFKVRVSTGKELDELVAKCEELWAAHAGERVRDLSRRCSRLADFERGLAALRAAGLA